MALDVWIYGSGFGESILLMWDGIGEKGDTERYAGFIDCYGGRDYESHPALCQWLSDGCPRVALACITHPHLDHIRYASVMMAAAGCTADKVVWWGGHDLRYLRAFYAQMREDLALTEHELGLTAEMTWGFLNDLDALGKGIHKCIPMGPKASVTTAMGTDPVLSTKTADGVLRFYAVSPWLGPLTTYTKWVNSQVYTVPTGRTEVRPNRGVANCASLGFLIQYGNAQVLLGGDMEADNWAQFHTVWPSKEESAALPRVNPCLIKVSHHGSATGTIDGMWRPRSGFFSSLERCGGQEPHCVITPWQMGDSRWHLPDRAVVDMISQAGCHVWETASFPSTNPIDRSTRPVGSFIHFVINPERNEVAQVSYHSCRHTDPQ